MATGRAAVLPGDPAGDALAGPRTAMIQPAGADRDGDPQPNGPPQGPLPPDRHGARTLPTAGPTRQRIRGIRRGRGSVSRSVGCGSRVTKCRTRAPRLPDSFGKGRHRTVDRTMPPAVRGISRRWPISWMLVHDERRDMTDRNPVKPGIVVGGLRPSESHASARRRSDRSRLRRGMGPRRDWRSTRPRQRSNVASVAARTIPALTA